MTAKAIINGKVLAESDKYKVVNGEILFPPESVKWMYFKQGSREMLTPDKGKAKSLDVVFKNKTYKNVAWSYPNPVETARYIASHVAFEKEIELKV